MKDKRKFRIKLITLLFFSIFIISLLLPTIYFTYKFISVKLFGG